MPIPKASQQFFALMRYSLFSIISFLFFLSLFDWIQSSGIWLVFPFIALCARVGAGCKHW